MTKIKLLLAVVVAAVSLQLNAQEVQNVFWGNKLASAFSEFSVPKNLTINNEDGDGIMLVGRDDSSIEFGGMFFDLVYAKKFNNSFASISFIHSFNEAKSANDFFDKLLKTVSAKYPLAENSANGTMYMYNGTQSSCVVLISEAESVYTVSLCYLDNDLAVLEQDSDTNEL